MAKTKLVIFTANNARILVGADPANYPTALVNPDLSAVGSIPPHYWKCVDDKILPMSLAEKKLRDDEHRLHGVDNDVEKYRAGAPYPADLPKPTIKWRRLEMPGKAFWIGLAGAIASFLAGLSL